jgi:hypothetical protein
MSAENFKLSEAEISAFYADRAPDLKRPATGWWRGPCPLHEGEDDNFKVNPENGNWRCHSQCDEGGSMIKFEMKFSGVDYETALRNAHDVIEGQWQPVAKYVYTDEDGNSLFRKVRLQLGEGNDYQKKFYFERYVDGKWVLGLSNVRRVPYRLDQLVQENHAFVVEGEKDCDTLCERLDLFATTSPLGAGEWRPEYNQYFDGIASTIIPHNDDKGYRHALLAAENLLDVTRKLKILEVPKPHKDITDWVNGGGTREDLIELRRGSCVIESTEQLNEYRRRWGIDEHKAKSENGLKLERLGDLLAQPREPVKWLWKYRLPVGTVNLIVSKAKVGKSTFSRNLALAVARGEDFLGFSTTQGSVVYLVLEECGKHVIGDFRAMGASISDDIEISYAAGVPGFLDFIRKEKPALVIVDPLFRLVRIRDERSYAEAYSAIGPLVDVARETGTVILLIHHSSKWQKIDPVDAPIGSMGFSAICSTLFRMQRTGKTRSIETVQRVGRDFPAVVLDYDPLTKVISRGASLADVAAQDVEQQIRTCLKSGALTEPEINELIHGRNDLKRNALRDLLKKNVISRSGKGARGSPYCYNLA